MSNRKSVTGTTFITKKWVSQWEDLMREFTEKHKVTCNVTEEPVSPRLKYPTGCSYEGAFDAIGMSGYGEYTYPNGVVYRGQFEDGEFHGDGELIYSEGPEAGSIIRGTWVKGTLTERKVLFNGTLEYDEHKWKYCEFPDRRYGVEYETDLQPAGKAHLTPDEPPREIPPGMYDSGWGFYNPETKVVTDYERPLDVIRGPSRREQKWLEDNCRKAPLDTIGPRRDLYESWTGPVPEPEPLPSPVVGFNKKFKKSSFFEHMEEDVPAFYNPISNMELISIPQRKFHSAHNIFR